MSWPKCATTHVGFVSTNKHPRSQNENRRHAQRRSYNVLASALFVMIALRGVTLALVTVSAVLLGVAEPRVIKEHVVRFW